MTLQGELIPSITNPIHAHAPPHDPVQILADRFKAA